MDYLRGEYWNKFSDHEGLTRYPLMSSGPLPIISIVVAYLYFVKVLGPRLMESRKPYELKWSMRAYNLYMTITNLYSLYRVLPLSNYGLDYFGCKEIAYKDKEVANEFIFMGYVYFLSKLLELLDTVFFVLRKKQNQVSHLHVFHHSFMIICVWTYLKLAPGGSSVLFPLLNAIVHTIMYFYYFLSTFKSALKYLWWKRHLTEAQIVQFILTIIHFSYQGLSSCDYSPALAIVGITFNFIFLLLFCDFYYHAYLKPSRKGERQRAEKSKANKPQGLEIVASLFGQK